MPLWNLAHTFHDGTNEPASGVQVTEDFEQLKAKIEALETEIGPLLATAALLGGEWKIVTAEMGFGPVVISTTKPSFATVTSHKPGGNTAFLGVVSVGGVAVATLADGEYGAGFTMARTVGLWVPPNAAITLATPNLAAMQPVGVVAVIL